MKKIGSILLSIMALMVLAFCGEARFDGNLPSDPNVVRDDIEGGDKIIVYQMLTRLFGNTNTNNVAYGSVEENGVGKFNDINDAALESLAELGITHVWYTGVIEHAVMADYSAFGIAVDDADVIKGRAGSPYAIKDYYDVNPDLAENVRNRMDEFEDLVERTHDAGLEVIIDFVPNHVARGYGSDNLPAGVEDLGASDDTSVGFAVDNNFYYIVGEDFVVPEYDPLGDEIVAIGEDGFFDESPAKVTGNDIQSASPSKDDWFETVKLNYGKDIFDGNTTYYDEIPDTWGKMTDILLFWAGKGVDAVRCDMAEMVPAEFWEYATAIVKDEYPDFTFIAEIYTPSSYDDYIDAGFDYLYDKVGLYDSVKPLIKDLSSGNTSKVDTAWKTTKNFSEHMLTFLENHDEERLINFGKGAENEIVGMTVTATLYPGPVMIYFGQEVGVWGSGKEGFSGGLDKKTTIFDYWGLTEMQGWINGYAYDGAGLTEEQLELRSFYHDLFWLCRDNNAIANGNTYSLYYANKRGISEGDYSKVYPYLRYTDDQKLLIVANFEQETDTNCVLKIPQEAWDAMGLDSSGYYSLNDIFLKPELSIEFEGTNTTDRTLISGGIPISLPPNTVYVFEITEAERFVTEE